MTPTRTARRWIDLVVDDEGQWFELRVDGDPDPVARMRRTTVHPGPVLTEGRHFAPVYANTRDESLDRPYRWVHEPHVRRYNPSLVTVVALCICLAAIPVNFLFAIPAAVAAALLIAPLILWRNPT